MGAGSLNYKHAAWNHYRLSRRPVAFAVTNKAGYLRWTKTHICPASIALPVPVPGQQKSLAAFKEMESFSLQGLRHSTRVKCTSTDEVAYCGVEPRPWGMMAAADDFFRVKPKLSALAEVVIHNGQCSGLVQGNIGVDNRHVSWPGGTWAMAGQRALRTRRGSRQSRGHMRFKSPAHRAF